MKDLINDHGLDAGVKTPALLTEKKSSAGFLQQTKAGRSLGCYGESDLERINIFVAIVKAILDMCSEMFPVSFFLTSSSGETWSRPRPLEYLYDKRKSHASQCIEAAMQSQELSYYSAIFSIAARIGVKPEHCCQAFPKTQPYEKDRYDPVQKIPVNLIVGADEYTLFRLIPVHSVLADIIGYYCVYQDRCHRDKMKVLIAGIHKIWNEGYYMIGVASMGNYLTNRHKIAKNSFSKVILAIDLLVGTQMDALLQENPSLSDAECICTTFYGGSSAVHTIILDDLKLREIIILPEPTREGWLKAVELGKRLYKEGAARVIVYPWPLIAYASLNGAILSYEHLSDSWERHVLGNLRYLDDVEQLSVVIKRLEDQACVLRDFVALGKDLGVFKDERSMAILNENTSGLIKFETAHIESAPREAVRNAVIDGRQKFNLDDIIKPSLLTLIWASTNMGKSIFSLHIACVLAFLLEMVIFEAKKARKVAILDGESTTELFKRRMAPLSGKYYIAPENMHNLRYILNKELPSSGKIQLLCPTYQQALLEKCLCDGISILVIDNLMALCPEVLSSPLKFAEFRRFNEILAENDIAVILVHHSNKDGNSVKGLVDIESLCQNVFNLSKPDTRQEDTMKHGLHCVFTATKCKTSPELENVPQELFLPLNEGTWQNLSIEVVEPLSKDGTGEQVVSVDLTHDEQVIMKAVITSDTKSITRKDVEDVLPCKEDKARAVLNALIKKGCLDRTGAGSDTRYKLRTS